MMRLEGRIINLDKHFTLASKDVDEIKISAKKATKRVFNIERFEFEELSQSDTRDKTDSSEVGKILDGEGSKKIKLI
jgi:DNA anti-recombination protein RmuC